MHSRGYCLIVFFIFLLGEATSGRIWGINYYILWFWALYILKWTSAVLLADGSALGNATITGCSLSSSNMESTAL